MNLQRKFECSTSSEGAVNNITSDNRAENNDIYIYI